MDKIAERIVNRNTGGIWLSMHVQEQDQLGLYVY